ncbi:Protein LONGIFOLIA 1 [Platanthera zijinensis]|uniref:Protein LONGIFOLIA 1 n=1 Tax=Platanthera zijinensis TaxID=2320716 RepID=A0AAP0BFI0_9ASPA
MFKRQINTISPRLQQIKADMEKKASSSILTCDAIKSPRQCVNCQSSDSLSPRCKLWHKPSKVKDSELQNSVDRVNVEEYRAKRLYERKTQLKRSIQGSSIKNYSVILKDLPANELELVLSPQRSSPNSVLEALLKEGGLTHSPVSVSATEIFQASGLLHKEHDLLSMFDQINFNNPSKFVEKTNPKKLHQKLISDTVNEILAEQIEISGSIKYLQDCREKSLDENSKIHKKLLQHSQVRDSFKSEVPVIVLEIERLIFKDLINEVVNGETAVFLEAKLKWCRKQHFARNGT